jgi:hypothetical protein
MAIDANSVPANTFDSLYPGNLSDPFAPGGAFGIPTAETFDFAKYGIPTEGNFNLGSYGIPTAETFDFAKYGIPTEGSFDFAKYGIPSSGSIPNFGGGEGGIPIA